MPETNVKSPLIDETAEYLGVSRGEVLGQIVQMRETLHKDWFKAAPGTFDELKKFYNESPLHLVNVVDFNTWSDAQRPPVTKKSVQDYGIKTALDYGCGCGTTALHLAEMGVKVSIMDISEHLVKFAKWRLEKRGFIADVVPIIEVNPLKANYDLITCVDVLEHLMNPLEMIYHFRSHATYFYATALKAKSMSQHLVLWPREKIVEIMGLLGWAPQWLSGDGGRGLFA